MAQTSSSGLSVRLLRGAPQGRVLRPGDLVGVLYAGSLDDGTQFDANFNVRTFQQVRDLFAFTLGAGEVISGWDQGLVNRQVGEVLDIRIPPELGYGDRGATGIPGGANLNFRVIIIGVIPKNQMSLPPSQRQPIYADLAALGLSSSALNLTPEVLGPLTPSIENGNLIVGTDLADGLVGFDVPELLIGLRGGDRITGGLGRDVQVGGLGSDRFIFRRRGDSLPGDGSRDVITDFNGGLTRGDRLDLSAIDADSTRLGDQAFRFVGRAAFSGSPGELRYRGGVVSADVDGDRQSDMEIGLLGAPALSATDVIL